MKRSVGLSLALFAIASCGGQGEMTTARTTRTAERVEDARSYHAVIEGVAQGSSVMGQGTITWENQNLSISIQLQGQEQGSIVRQTLRSGSCPDEQETPTWGQVLLTMDDSLRGEAEAETTAPELSYPYTVNLAQDEVEASTLSVIQNLDSGEHSLVFESQDEASGELTVIACGDLMARESHDEGTPTPTPTPSVPNWQIQQGQGQQQQQGHQTQQSDVIEEAPVEATEEAPVAESTVETVGESSVGIEEETAAEI